MDKLDVELDILYIELGGDVIGASFSLFYW